MRNAKTFKAENWFPCFQTNFAVQLKIHTKKTLVDYLYQTKPKLAFYRQGQVNDCGARIQTKWVLFGVFSTSRFAPLALSSNWIFSQRRKCSFFPLTGRGWKIGNIFTQSSLTGRGWEYFHSIFSGLYYFTSNVMIFTGHDFYISCFHVTRLEVMMPTFHFYIMLIITVRWSRNWSGLR